MSFAKQQTLFLDPLHVASPRVVDGYPAAESRARETAPDLSGRPALKEVHEQLASPKPAEVVTVLQADLDRFAALSRYAGADASLSRPYL